MGPLTAARRAIKALFAACAIVASVISFSAQGQSSSADRIGRWQGHIAEAATRFGIPADWVVRVIEAESGGRTELGGRPITSHAGAMGLMQIMPATWASLRAQYSLGDDPYDPRDNIVAGTAYLRTMYDRFGYPGLFGAYNAGPGRYEEYVSRGRPLPRETRDYMAKIAGSAAHRSDVRRVRPAAIAAPRAADVDPIFLARRSGAGDVQTPAAIAISERSETLSSAGSQRPPAGSSLFAVRRDGGGQDR